MRRTKPTSRILAASLLVLALAWQHIQATRLGYQVERSRREAQLLKGQNASLAMELESRLSPARVSVRAKERLGMFPAPPESLRIL